ncbi:MAG: sigma 54-interacting transcriptional regulator [Planctomycetota bacterium]|jgi:transcriptional regulator of acetoin/glycerol metabolism|nr:sigma 54-interacting transcriptional regulator [Planctomycetota bacterium]
MQNDIIKAKYRFLLNLPIPEGVVRKEILESWRRSKNFGVNPDNVDKSVIAPDELSRRIAERRTFYDIAVPFIESLSAFTLDSGFLTTLCDEEGYILRLIGNPGILSRSTADALVEGCNRSERRLGTNGVGTPLETGKPIQVFSQEHFYSVRVNWVCSGAPIFDAQDRIIGVFTIIGADDKVSFHTLGMAVAAAEAITRQLKMKAAYDFTDTIRNHMNIMTEYVPSGLLLLNGGMAVKQANNRAAGLLGFERDELNTLTFQQLFGNNAVEARELETGFSDKQVTIQRHGRIMNISLSLIVASNGTYVATFERMETLHKKISRITGSQARFSFADVLGNSPIHKNAVEQAKTAAKTNSTVLLLGESGTGKELFAQAIHNASDRRDGSFVAINCGALPKSLVHSELFGYEGGSFTGARREGRAGKFELANGGTIFLDEIGDMPFDVQASLLRVLQNREVVRIGDNRARKIDVRVIAATNLDLHAAIENHTFRGDLYYRLNVFNIHIPPLRNRVADIPLLADFFLGKYSELAGGAIFGFKKEVYDWMERHRWPGNIRELENTVERAINIAQSGWIGLESLPFVSMIDDGAPDATHKAAAFSGTRSIRITERNQIEETLRITGGNITKAAEMLEISRRTIYRKIEKYGLKPASVSEASPASALVGATARP